MVYYSTGEKGKVLNYEGSQYTLGSTRKDGSEIWKCIERDCKGQLLKRIIGVIGISPNIPTTTVIKEHTEHMPSSVKTTRHLALAKLKQLALSDPTIPPDQVLKQTKMDIWDTIDSYIPSTNEMTQLVLKWRAAEKGIDIENIVHSSNNNNNNNHESKSRPRKRIKLDIIKSPSSSPTVHDVDSLKSEVAENN